MENTCCFDWRKTSHEGAIFHEAEMGMETCGSPMGCGHRSLMKTPNRWTRKVPPVHLEGVPTGSTHLEFEAVPQSFVPVPFSSQCTAVPAT